MKKKLIIRIISLSIIVIAIIAFEYPNIKNWLENIVDKYKWQEIEKLEFQDREKDILSIIISDDLKTVYSYVKESGSGIVKKEGNNIIDIPTRRPYSAVTFIDKLRSNKPIKSASKKYPGIIVQDSATKGVYFIKWNSDLANDFCGTIKDDNFNNYCEKYKNYTYPEQDFLVYSDIDVTVPVKYEIRIKDAIYTIYDDNLMYVNENGNTKILGQPYNDHFDGIVKSIIEEGTLTDELNPNSLKDVHNNKYYAIEDGKKSTVELARYLYGMIGYAATEDLVTNIIIYKYRGSVDDNVRMYNTTSGTTKDYDFWMSYICKNKNCKGMIDSGQDYFIIEDEDFYIYEDNGDKIKPNQDDLKKMEIQTLYYYDDIFNISVALKEKNNKKLLYKYECKTSNCSDNIKNDYSSEKNFLIKDDAWYLYDTNKNELKTLSLDINKNYYVINTAEEENYYIVIEQKEIINNNYDVPTDIIIVDKTNLIIKKIITTPYIIGAFSFAERVRSGDNEYIVLSSSFATTAYHGIYDGDFNPLIPLASKHYARFRNYQVLDNGNLLLIDYESDELKESNNSYDEYKIYNHVELNHKGELINPQIYNHKTRIIKDIVFEYGDNTINVYDLNHNLLASTELIRTRENHNDYSEPIYSCYNTKNNSDYSPFDFNDNEYWTHYGNSGSNAIKYTFNKNTNRITTEQTDCFITEK